MNSTNNNSFEIAAKNVFSDLYDLIKEDKNMTKNEINRLAAQASRLGGFGTYARERALEPSHLKPRQRTRLGRHHQSVRLKFHDTSVAQQHH